mgnify:CR=1 FL=1
MSSSFQQLKQQRIAKSKEENVISSVKAERDLDEDSYDDDGEEEEESIFDQIISV